MAAPTTGANRSVATGYAPAAGADAGAAAGGGELSTGVARTAYVAAPRAASAAAAQPQLAASGQVANANNFAAVTRAATAAPAAAAGPAGWNDEWDGKFVDAGTDAQTMQQLRFTGGLGLDDAQLEQALQQVGEQSDALVEQLRKEHGHEVEKLERANVPKSVIAATAQRVLSGEVDEKTFVKMVDGAYGMTSSGLTRSLFGDMIPYGIVPGWGLLTGAAGVAGGLAQGDVSRSTNPASDRRLFGTRMDAAFTPLMAGGGAVTLYALHQEQQRIKAGRSAVANHLDTAQLAKRLGATMDTGALAAPWKASSKQAAALGRYAEFQAGVAHLQSVADARIAAGLKPGEVGAQAAIGQDMLRQWQTGKTAFVGDPVMGVMKKFPIGMFNKSRGSLPGIGNRGKQLAEATVVKGMPTVKMDVRLKGPALTAHLIAAGTQLADGKARMEMLAKHADPAPRASVDATRRMRELLMANTTKDLMESTKGSAALLQRPTDGRLAAGVLRPGTVDDAFKAVKRLDTGELGYKGPFGLVTKFQDLPVGSKSVMALGDRMMASKSGATAKVGSKVASLGAALPSAPRLGALAAGAAAVAGVGYLGIKGFGWLMGDTPPALGAAPVAAPAAGEQPAATAATTAAEAA